MGVAPFPRGGRTKKLALGVLSRGGTIVCRRKREQDGPIAENRGRGNNIWLWQDMCALFGRRMLHR